MVESLNLRNGVPLCRSILGHAAMSSELNPFISKKLIIFSSFDALQFRIDGTLRSVSFAISALQFNRR